MNRVYKYTVPLCPGEYTLETGHALSLLSAGQQSDKIAIWAITDLNSRNIATKVQVLFTGQQVTGVLKWFATFTDNNGLVYHLFEKL